MPAPRASTQVAPSPLSQALGQIRDVVSLAKPRLSGLVVSTTAGGMWLAPGHLSAPRAAAVLVGTTAVVGAANALNNYLERDVDALMRRTRDRPLPAGRLQPGVALAVGIGLPALALPILSLAAGPLTAFLALVALVSYVCVYTPLKRRSTLALFVGAVPGAIPPLMGWTGVTGHMGAGGLALFALLFVWQLPHFLAISIYLKDDYARGGLKVFALVHGERTAKLWAAATSLALVPAALVLVPLRLAGPAFGATAAVLGLGLAAHAFMGVLDPAASTRWARNFFLLTLAYLSLLFAALFLFGR